MENTRSLDLDTNIQGTGALKIDPIFEETKKKNTSLLGMLKEKFPMAAALLTPLAIGLFA